MAGLHIGIMGAGSIGCFVGARLQAGGARVRFVGRASLGDEIARHGLTTTTFDESRTVAGPDEVDWTDDASTLGDVDVVLVCVKSLATAEVARELASILREDCVVLSLQNGVSNAPTLAAELAPRAVFPCMVPFNVLRMGEGRFHQGTSGHLTTSDDVPPRIVAAFRAAGLELEQHADMRGVMWGKLLININNAINALSDIPLKQQIESPVWRRVMARNIAEGLAVVRAAGIEPVSFVPVPLGWLPRLLRLPTWLLTRVARRLVAIDPEARSSMWEDLQRGRTTEVDFLNGEIVALGERHGVDTPVNRLIVEAIHRAEAGEDVARWAQRLQAEAR